MKRHPLEREGDVLFLVGLLRAQPKLSGTQAAEILNDRREAAAREAATAAGGDVEAAAAAGREARLSEQMVRADIRMALDRAREAATGGAAVFLDEQIAACRQDVDRTYDLDEQIVADLERSRRPRQTETRGRRPKGGGEVQPTELVTRTQERAGEAAFYALLVKNIECRIRLREEMRLLRLGRHVAIDAEERAATVAEAWAGLVEAGPERAREVALRLYAQEMQNLARASAVDAGPLPAEIQRAEALRVAKIRQRIDGLRQFVPLAEPAGDRRAYELVLTFSGDDGAPPS